MSVRGSPVFLRRNHGVNPAAADLSAHFPLLDELAHYIGNILNGNILIDPVLVVEVNVVQAQPLQRCLQACSGALECHLPRAAFLAIHVQLGGDHHLVADWPQGLAHQPFVVTLARVS